MLIGFCAFWLTHKNAAMKMNKKWSVVLKNSLLGWDHTVSCFCFEKLRRSLLSWNRVLIRLRNSLFSFKWYYSLQKQSKQVFNDLKGLVIGSAGAWKGMCSR